MSFYVRRPWTEQTNGALPRADAGSLLFWDANGTTGPSQKVLTRRGVGRVFSSTSLTLERSGNPAGGFMFVAVVDATAASSFPMILTADVGASDVVELRLFDNTGRPEFVVKPSGGGYIEARSATSIVGVGAVTLVGVYKPAGVVELWQDGRLVASASGTGGAVSWNATLFRLGARAIGGSFTFDGRILLAAVIDSQRSAESPADISTNPWQLFEPRRVWIPQSAPSSIPVLSAATVFDITATSARPRVTITI